MAFSHVLVLVSALLSIGGSSAYIRNTLKGATKPNRVSWGLWAFAPLIGTAAALSAHADIWATVRIFLAGFLPLIIFLVSFVNPRGYWKLTRFDLACGLSAGVALLCWALADSPRLAILFSALADGLACLPTLVKAWKYPETETAVTYVCSFLSAILIIPSIPRWDIENSAFQVYLIIANTLLLLAVYRKRLGISLG